MSARCEHCQCKIESGYHERGCPVRERSGPATPSAQQPGQTGRSAREYEQAWLYAAGRVSEMEIDIRELRAALLAAWTYPSGTKVTVTLDDGSEWQTRTRSEAWALGSGAPVVLLEGKTGGYSLERCRLRK